MLYTHTIQDGTTVDWYGPTAVEIRNTLDKAGHTRSRKGKTPNSIPSVGYVATKPRDVAYVEVSSTMRGYGTDSYRRTLEDAGYVVRDSTQTPGALTVFCAPRERDQDGKILRRG